MYRLIAGTAVLGLLVLKFLQGQSGRSVRVAAVLHVSDFSELVEAYTREFNRVTFLLVKREDVSPRLKDEALDFPEDARYCIVVAEVGEDGNIGSILDMRFCRELGIELRALFQKNNNVILCKK